MALTVPNTVIILLSLDVDVVDKDLACKACDKKANQTRPFFFLLKLLHKRVVQYIVRSESQSIFSFPLLSERLAESLSI